MSKVTKLKTFKNVITNKYPSEIVDKIKIKFSFITYNNNNNNNNRGLLFRLKDIQNAFLNSKKLITQFLINKRNSSKSYNKNHHTNTNNNNDHNFNDKKKILHKWFIGKNFPFLTFLKWLTTSSSRNSYSILEKVVIWKAFALIPMKFIATENVANIVNQDAYEIEKQISSWIAIAEESIAGNDCKTAKMNLSEALRVSEETHFFNNLSIIYELLSIVAAMEGSVSEAEDILAKGIDKLHQHGFTEDDNSVIQLKLKLSRLYQTIGNMQMAELGFRDCIALQEKKMSQKNSKSKTRTNDNENITNLIYINSLFWYGKLLLDTGEFKKAKTMMKKAIDRIPSCPNVSASQTMVVLYYASDVAMNLKEYDSALFYLYSAVDICNKQDKENSDLPLYIVKIGEIFLLKLHYQNALFWCTTAHKLARNYACPEAERRATKCLQEVQSSKITAKEENEVNKE